MRNLNHICPKLLINLQIINFKDHKLKFNDYMNEVWQILNNFSPSAYQNQNIGP